MSGNGGGGADAGAGAGGAAADSRTRVLAAVRSALGRGPDGGDAERSEAIEARIAAHETHVRPPVEGDLAARFAAKAEVASATFAPVRRVEDVSRAVAAYLEEHGLGKDIVATSDPLLERVPWSNELSVERRAAEARDRTSVVGAYAGIAETGTVVFVSDRTTPTTLNFLPETHVAVLARGRLVAHLEDVWARLRAERTALPRTVNFITGPSRTGDIELQLELGAHGPRRLHVILVEDG